MNRIEPLAPTLSRGRTASFRSVPSNNDSPGSDKLYQEAHKKFQSAFSDAQSGVSAHPHLCEEDDEANVDSRPMSASQRSPGRPLPSLGNQRSLGGGGFGRLPPRSASVLGIRSSGHDIEGHLLRGNSPEDRRKGKPLLDYVDLECLLHEKMRELNVQLPSSKSKSSRNKSKLDAGEDAALLSEHGADGLDTRIDYVQRVREAAFLFRLCQQEIKLQVNISCPERSRLIEKALDFWSAILDCLVTPLDQASAHNALLQQHIVASNKIADSLRRDLYAWSKERVHLLETHVWQQLPPQDAAAASALRAQLRTLALRSSYVEGSAHSSSSSSSSSSRGQGVSGVGDELNSEAPYSPSPPLLSRASTSEASARPLSRRVAGGRVAEARRGEGSEGGWGDLEERLRQQEEVRGIGKALLGCLAAASTGMVKLHEESKRRDEALERQREDAERALSQIRTKHADELQRAEEARERAVRELEAAQEAMAAEQSKGAQLEVRNTELQHSIAALQDRVALMEEAARTAAADGAARLEEVGKERNAAVAARESIALQLAEYERLAAQERAEEQAKLAKTVGELDAVRADLSRLSKDGIVLTPRPVWRRAAAWAGAAGESEGEDEGEQSSAAHAARLEAKTAAGEERIAALEREVNELNGVLVAAREQADKERVLRATAEERSGMLAAELQALRDRPRSDAACGCPEPPEDRQIVMVELGEYLVTYLSKRFGLQGHMASWEVEKLGKDLGWVMEQPVRCAVQS